MGEASQGPPSVAEFVEYCRTQARLLAGRADAMWDDVAEQLDEIDAEAAAIESALAERSADAEGTTGPPSTEAPTGSGGDVADLEERESALEEQQAVVEATQARLERFQALAGGYADLAASLQAEAEDESAALAEIVEFEEAEDAPAFFEDRQTLLEAAAEANDEGST